VWAVGCGVLAAGLAVPARAAVTDYVGKPIASVRFIVEGRDAGDPSLSDRVQTRVGRSLSMADVRESVTHLYSLGQFEDVRVDASLAANGVAVRYDLSLVHPVSKIAFAWKANAAGVDEERLRRAAIERGGTSLRVSRAGEMAAAVKGALGERGYLNPTVAPSTEILHAPHSTTLVFTIDPGPRTVIGDLSVTGLPGMTPAEFLGQLGLARGAPYEPEALAARRERYLATVRRRGYYEAKVTPVLTLADANRVANLAVVVDRGPHVRVVFDGDRLPDNRRADLVPVEREGSVDEDLLEDSTNRIEEFLRAQGYRDAAAPHTRAAVGDELVITFKVNKGPVYRVARVQISGNTSVPLVALEPNLRLREGMPFSAARLDADIAAIEEFYKRSGFVGAKAESGVEPQAAAGASPVPVAVRIIIREGVRTLVGSVTFSGNQSIDATTLSGLVRLQPDRPFVPAQLAVDRDAVLLHYLNLGYENATIDVKPDVSRDGTRADLLFAVREGSQILIDHVIVVGNVRTSTETIERELQLHAGEPLGREARFESQRRLSALGLFRRVSITELGHGDDRRRDVLVTVEEASTTTIAYGGGVEGRRLVVQEANGLAGEEFQFAPRASFEIGRRNLFGKNRSATAFASGSLPLSRQQTASDTPTTNVGEFRFGGTYREPRIFDTSADAFINVTLEQQRRSSFDFRRRSATVEIARRFRRVVSVSGNYQIQRVEVFNNLVTSEQLLIDRTFPKVRLSSFSASVSHDTRNDPADAASGNLFSADGQLAARAIGSKVGFVKSRFTAQMFRSLPKARGIVFAGSARLGLASAFPREAVDDQERVIVGSDGQPLIVDELYASERFYAGGDTTIRGFALDAVGVRHDPPQTVDTIDPKGFPLGGNGVVILNAELRVPVRGGLQGAGFVDTGNVFQRVTTMDLTELRTAVGFGVRYKSPIGPIRVDLGFKVNRRPDEPLREWFVTFGQAF